MKIISQRGFVLLALLGLVATLALATAAGAATDLQPLEQAPSAETGQMTDESSKYWFVEFPTAPLADGSSAAAVDSDGAEFRQEASSEGASYKERMEFKTLWNGVSIEAKSGAIAKIRQFDSVKAVYPQPRPRPGSIARTYRGGRARARRDPGERGGSRRRLDTTGLRLPLRLRVAIRNIANMRPTRSAKPADIAAALLFLASDLAGDLQLGRSDPRGRRRRGREIPYPMADL